MKTRMQRRWEALCRKLPAGMSVRTEVECEDPNFTGLGSIETWVQETPGSATGWNVTIWNDNENKDVTEYFKHIAVVDGTLTIEPAPVIVKADNKSKYVDADDPELTATVTGLVGDETVAYTLSREAGEGVGRYTITPTGEKNQGHYEVTFETGTFTINRAGGGSSGGNGGEDPKPDEPLIYTLTYDDGTGTVTENYPEGTTVTLTRTPTRDGYRFTGWYLDPEKTQKVTRVKVDEDMTLYAGWEKIDSPNGGNDNNGGNNNGTSGNNSGKGRTADSEEEGRFFELKEFARRFKTGLIVEIVLAVLAVLVFILTENLKMPMALIDKWTPVMILMMLAAIAADIRLVRYRGEEPEEEMEENTEEHIGEVIFG